LVPMVLTFDFQLEDSIVNPKDFLLIAEDYATLKGDQKWFKETYERFRVNYTVCASVRNTLEYLYGTDIAKFLEGKQNV
jgi:hypothetical protein